MEINVYRFGRNGDGQGEMSRQLKLFIGRRELGRVEKYEVFDTSKKIYKLIDRSHLSRIENTLHISKSTKFSKNIAIVAVSGQGWHHKTSIYFKGMQPTKRYRQAGRYGLPVAIIHI
jgi:hypothetical protein